jgi:predicted PurR-regulated permease PerM
MPKAKKPAPPVVVQLPHTPHPASVHVVLIEKHTLLSIVAFALAALCLYAVRGSLLTIMFACIVTFLGDPLVTRLESKKVPRAVGAILFLLVVMSVLFALVALIAPPLTRDLIELFQQAPALLTQLATFIETRFHVNIPTSISELSAAATKEALDQLKPYAEKGGAFVGQGAATVLSGAVSALSFVTTAALVPILAFFMLSEWPDVRAFLCAHLGATQRPSFDRWSRVINDALSKLVRGQLTVAALMSALYLVGLSISGVPIALAIALLAGMAYLIPFASATVGLALSVVMCGLELREHALPAIVGAVITCVAVQLLEGYVLTPRIVGKNAGLSPLATFLAVVLGGSAGGFLGVLFALPVGCVLSAIVDERARLTASGA